MRIPVGTKIRFMRNGELAEGIFIVTAIDDKKLTLVPSIPKDIQPNDYLVLA